MRWATSKAVSRQPQEGSLDTLRGQFERALRLSDTSDPRRGVFNGAEAQACEGALEWYLQLTRLEGMLAAASAAECPPLVPLPWLDVPIQPVMIHRRKFSAEISLSLKRPLPDRPVRRVAFWTHGVATVEYELEAVRSAMSTDTELVVFRDQPLKRFADLWSDGSFDVIWISAHGELERSERDVEIAPAPSGPITSHELARLKRPLAEQRRLIVLNVCDSAATESFAGLSGLGLAASICDRDQAVVGHLWPAEVLESAAFGALLGRHLCGSPGFYEAFQRTMLAYIGTSEELGTQLRAAGAQTLADRIAPPHGRLPARSLAQWGSPAFVA